MNRDLERAVELYRLKAEKFGNISATNQQKYYDEVANWIVESNFNSLEEATAKMRETPYYHGGAIAKHMDDIDMRIKAMKEVGYDDVVDIHLMRREKLIQRGNGYAFSQEWIDDMGLAQEKVIMYARRKEAFGKIFQGYFEIKGNPQKEHRKNGEKSIEEGLKELEELGASFYELAKDKVYRNLIMTTEKGMDNFVEFVRAVQRGISCSHEIGEDIGRRQQEIGRWVKENRQKLMEVGREEVWKDGACVAVPSDDPMGYDYLAIKEV